MASIGGANIVTDGLVLALDAANKRSYPGSGTVWSDLSGNNLTSTLTNGPTFSSTNGGAIVFDGNDDYTRILTSGIVNNNITIDIWFNISSSKLYGSLLGSNITEKYEMLIKDSINLEISLSSANYIQHNNILSINQWTNIIVVAPNGIAWKVYKNGVDLGAPLISNGSYQVDGTSVSNIDQGIIRNDTGFAYLGLIGTTKIYNRALSPSEVLQNYNATKTRFGL